MSNVTALDCAKKIDRLEHVVAEITFECSQRGEVEFILTSAQGTTSTLLTKRKRDTHAVSSFSWRFMSVHYWGESPSGLWTLKMRIRDESFTGYIFI